MTTSAPTSGMDLLHAAVTASSTSDDLVRHQRLNNVLNAAGDQAEDDFYDERLL